MNYIETGIDKGERNFKKAEECVERIFSLNPNSANGYYLRGHLNMWRGQIRESVRDHKHALSIDPNHYYSNFIFLSFMLYWEDRFCKTDSSELIKIDPMNPLSYLISGAVEIFDGQFSKAVEYLRKGYELEPLPFYEVLGSEGTCI